MAKAAKAKQATTGARRKPQAPSRPKVQREPIDPQRVRLAATREILRIMADGKRAGMFRLRTNFKSRSGAPAEQVFARMLQQGDSWLGLACTFEDTGTEGVLAALVRLASGAEIPTGKGAAA